MKVVGLAGDVLHLPKRVLSVDKNRTHVVWRCGASAKRALFIAADDPFVARDPKNPWRRVLRDCEGCFHPAIKAAKIRTHRLVQAAVRSGALMRGPCESCGSTHRVAGHHDDYNQPLSVRWLCGRCHLAWHRKNAAVPPLLEVPA